MDTHKHMSTTRALVLFISHSLALLHAHPHPSLTLTVRDGHVHVEAHTYTHTFPEALSTNFHTMVSCHWQSKHDRRALQGHLPVSHPCQLKALGRRSLCSRPPDTHTHYMSPSCHHFRIATASNNCSSWTNTVTLLQCAHVVLGLSPGPSNVYFMD